MLGIAGVVFDGTFCAQELAWRSGTICKTMGVLVVISSETSVITMVLLAAVRIFAVSKVRVALSLSLKCEGIKVYVNLLALALLA